MMDTSLYTFYYTSRPTNYREKARFHCARVAAAGGQGADEDFLTSYYQVIGENLASPRAFFTLRCGYRLNDIGTVEYLFDPHGADLVQTDSRYAAKLGSSPSGLPVLVFSGSQGYEAVDSTRYNLGTRDLVLYTALRVDQRQPFQLLRKGSGGSGYYSLFDGGDNYSYAIMSTAEAGYYDFQGNGGFYGRSQGGWIPYFFFVLRGPNRTRGGFMPYGYQNEMDPIPTQTGARYQDSSNSDTYILGGSLIGAIGHTLNLAASPGGVASSNIGSWIARIAY